MYAKFEDEIELAKNTDELLDHLNVLMMAGGMSDDMREVIADHIEPLTQMTSNSASTEWPSDLSDVDVARICRAALGVNQMTACKPSMIDRRNFIRRSALAAVGSSSFSALTTQFNLAHAQVGGADDYRALVCLSLRR